MKKICMITLLVSLLVTVFTTDVMSFSKHALVIGNGDYQEVPLRNPVHDAQDMTAILESLGFSITKKLNISQQEMENAIRIFGKQVQSNDVALFYFSGHGIQVNGVNYLLPIGIRIDSEDEIKYKAVPAEMVLDKLERAGSRLNIIILDACRNNPFKRFRSLSQGLAQMSSPAGTIIAYATAPGAVAYDSPERNSPYTKYLLKTMQTSGLPIERVFKQVRVAVMRDTDNKQIPWESSSLTGEFYFKSKLPDMESSPIVHDSAPQITQKVYLRKIPKFISYLAAEKMLNKYNFYEVEWNRKGSFENQCIDNN